MTKTIDPDAAASAAPSSLNWTPEQRRGITAGGRSILVSAAAGSGKTAILAQRCAHLVCDQAEPCKVDELLVVTFTEAAAAEMKSRIHAALRDRHAARPSEHLSRQLALVDQAQVEHPARILRTAAATALPPGRAGPGFHRARWRRGPPAPH